MPAVVPKVPPSPISQLKLTLTNRLTNSNHGRTIITTLTELHYFLRVESWTVKWIASSPFPTEEWHKRELSYLCPQTPSTLRVAAFEESEPEMDGRPLRIPPSYTWMSNKFYLNFLNKYNLRPFQEYLVFKRTSIPKIVKGGILNQRKREIP